MNDDLNIPKIESNENDVNSVLAPPSLDNQPSAPEPPLIEQMTEAPSVLDPPISTPIEQPVVQNQPMVNNIVEQPVSETTNVVEQTPVDDQNVQITEENVSNFDQLPYVGISRGKIILISLVLVAIAVFVMIKFGLNGTISIGGFEFTLNSSSSTRTTDDKNIIEGTTTTTVTNDSDNSDNAYDGEFIYSDEEINKVFEVTPINGFVSESNYNSIQYISDVVEYDIYGIQNFNDAKALADSVYSYNKKSYDVMYEFSKNSGLTLPNTVVAPKSPVKKSVNGIDWYYVGGYSPSEEVYYFTQKGKSIYLLSIRWLNKNEIGKNESQIVESVKYK